MDEEVNLTCVNNTTKSRYASKTYLSGGGRILFLAQLQTITRKSLI